MVVAVDKLSEDKSAQRQLPDRTTTLQNPQEQQVHELLHITHLHIYPLNEFLLLSHDLPLLLLPLTLPQTPLTPTHPPKHPPQSLPPLLHIKSNIRIMTPDLLTLTNLVTSDPKPPNTPISTPPYIRRTTVIGETPARVHSCLLRLTVEGRLCRVCDASKLRV